MRKSQQLKDISSRTVFYNKGPPDKSLPENFLIIFGCLVLFQWILCGYCNCFFVKYRAQQIDYVNSLKKLRNYNRVFLCPPLKWAKTQPAFWTTILHNKFTIWHIKLTTYRQKNEFTSNRQYFFCLFFFENPKKTRIYQSTLQFFDSVLKETTYKASKVATAKKIFSVGYIIGTTYFDKYFLFYVIIGIHSFL